LSGELTRTKSLLSKAAPELDDLKIKCVGYESSVNGYQTQLGKYEMDIRELSEKNEYLIMMTVMNLVEIDGLRARYAEKVAG